MASSSSSSGSDLDSSSLSHMNDVFLNSDPGSSSQSYKYDVFLSFRGEDTRNRFVDHLHKALEEKSIITFKDDKQLSAGEPISPSLLTAIEESQIAVIVFSENYADSSWCLEELAYIMKCEVDRGLIVMPIFYDVEPTDVRKQKKKFEEAFARHEKEKSADMVESWRKALANASNYVGFHSKDRPETAFIQEIVDEIFDRLFSKPYSDVDEGFVGMSSRIKEVKLRLKIGSDGVRMVGIWGVGGGGKTTLATSVFMEISHQFEGSCIVENVREKSSKLEKLQEMILSAIFKTEVKIHGVAEGKRKIKSMLCRRKVLVLLDDVDQLGQLEALAGSHNWFGNGSRVIITTRDEHLLKTHKVDDIYKVKLLSYDEATLLFNKHACNKKDPIKDYKRLSLHVVRYADGLPLALKVLGSFLYDKNEKEWMSALDRLKDIPEMEIVEKLKISYDGLKTEEKELFLDIACFFRGRSYDHSEYDSKVREILEACGFHLDVGIKVLSQKALINIDAKGRFEMHDLVQEMGHFIVRREHPKNPEYHSRVWKKEEIRNMLLQDATKKNDTIEAIGHWICWDFDADDDISWFCKNVSNMKKLRWLSVNMDKFSNQHAEDGGPSFLSNELCYIYWDNYPGFSFPHSFQPMKLVVIKLEYGLQKELWKGYKDLPCLKVLELKYMEALVSTPDFKGLPCLQKLTLEFCEALEEIHPSLGNHKSLEYVCISSCYKLRKFPTIVHMEKLQTLEIKNCQKIFEFPEIQANMESVGERCTSLTSLDICDFKRTEFNMDASKRWKANSISDTQLLLSDSEMRFHVFPRSLQKLDLSNCDLEDGKILSSIADLSNLKELNLSYNDFTQLDSGFFSQLTRLKILGLGNCYELEGLPELSQLTLLKIIKLWSCRRLVQLPELPSSVAFLDADYCDSLTSVGDSLTNCRCLRQVSLYGGGIINDGDRVLESMLQGNAIENGTMLLLLRTRLGIAKGFKPCLCDGNICRLELPEKWRNEFSGFLICVVFSGDYLTYPYSVKIAMEQVKKSGSLMDSQDEVVWEEKEYDDDVVTWVRYISFASLKKKNIPWWDQTYSQLSFSIPFEPDVPPIYGFGVRLVGKKGGSEISGSKDSSQLSKYAPDFRIDQVSPSSVQIDFPTQISFVHI